MGKGADSMLATALDASRFGVVLIDASSKILHANEVACSLLGRKERKLSGRALADLVHPGDRDWTVDAFGRLLAGTASHVRREIRLRDTELGEMWSEINAHSVAEGANRSVCAVVIIEDARDRGMREPQLALITGSDPYTGLLNRAGFERALEHHLGWAARYGGRGALLLLDIDRPGEDNERRGPIAGDSAIQTVAEILKERTRARVSAGRLAGGRFALLLPEADHEQASVMAKVLLRAVADSEARITLSIGIASAVAVSNAPSLFAAAHEALNLAKAAGGDCLRWELERDPVLVKASGW